MESGFSVAVIYNNPEDVDQQGAFAVRRIVTPNRLMVLRGACKKKW